MWWLLQILPSVRNKKVKEKKAGPSNQLWSCKQNKRKHLEVAEILYDCIALLMHLMIMIWPALKHSLCGPHMSIDCSESPQSVNSSRLKGFERNPERWSARSHTSHTQCRRSSVCGWWRGWWGRGQHISSTSSKDLLIIDWEVSRKVHFHSVWNVYGSNWALKGTKMCQGFNESCHKYSD